MTNDILERDAWTDIFAKLYLTIVETDGYHTSSTIEAIYSIRRHLQTHGAAICIQISLSRKYIFLHRFTIFKKIVTSFQVSLSRLNNS